MLFLSSPELFWGCTGECAALYTVSTISTDLIVTLIERRPGKSFKHRELLADITTPSTRLDQGHHQTGPWIPLPIQDLSRQDLDRRYPPDRQTGVKTLPSHILRVRTVKVEDNKDEIVICRLFLDISVVGQEST